MIDIDKLLREIECYKMPKSMKGKILRALNESQEAINTLGARCEELTSENAALEVALEEVRDNADRVERIENLKGIIVDIIKRI